MIRRLRARLRQALADLATPFDFDEWPDTDEPGTTTPKDQPHA